MKFTARNFVFLVCLSALLLCGCSSPQSTQATAHPPNEENPKSEPVSDDALQRVTVEALGEREGAVIVIDPQTGRLRAVVNPRLAFEQAFPPGSAIKPFTALAACAQGCWICRLSGNARPNTRAAILKSSVRIRAANSPFNLTQALAYSCNDYFRARGRTAERRDV